MRSDDAGERDGQIVETGRSPQAFAGKHHVGRNPEQVIRHLRRPVGVEHDGQSALARCLAKRPHEIGKSIVGEHRVDRRHQAGRVSGHDALELLVPVSHDNPIAARIDEDR